MSRDDILERTKYFFGGLIIAWLLVAIQNTNACAAPIDHKFKSPSFNGQNTSSHYLTIENQERTRKDALEQELEDAFEEAAREAENTTLARFLRNVESRIYSTLSRQLVDSMFGEDPSDTGEFFVDGAGISYVVDGDKVELTITDEFGNVTVIVIPIGNFGI